MSRALKVTAQIGLGAYAGLCIAFAFAMRHQVSAIAMLGVGGVLAIGQAVLSGYVWELARRGEQERPRIPSPVLATLAGVALFAGAIIMGMRP